MSVICYMSVIRLVRGGVVRVRLYGIYAHLCNHMLLRSGGDLGHSSVHRQRCGFWESGCRRLARKRPARRGSGAPSTDWLGAWGCLFRSHGLLDWSTLSLSGNKNTHMDCQVVVGPGAQLCTLLEVWVLGVGMSTLRAQTALYAEDRGLQVPMALEHASHSPSGVA